MFDKPLHWHASGDVLLLVIDHETEHKFRVHQYILSLHSTVWKDTFQLGTESKDIVSEVDGLLVIPLDDPVKDVCSLLSAFYLGVEDIRETRDFDAALGILKLSHKYEADRLFTTIHRILQESWPLSRVAYFALPRRQRVASSIKLIKAANKTHSTALLPVAFYELAATPVGETWTEDAMSLLGELSSKDLSRLFLGKNRMMQRYKAFTFQLYTEFKSGVSRYPCCYDRQQYVREVAAELNQSSEVISKTDSIPCRTCREWFVLNLQALEIEMWKNIPAYFDFPSVEMGKDLSVCKFFK